MVRTAILLLATISLFSADPTATKYEDYIFRARQAESKGLMGSAIKELENAVKSDPKRLEGYFIRARISALMRKHAEAIADLTKVIEIDPKAPNTYQVRGIQYLTVGEPQKAVDDFDQFLKLVPRRAAEHWQRGIALYLAGKFDEGKKQFELHQTVNSHDVENAVFHFACTARAEGFEKARAQLIPIEGDKRVPMQEIFNLFAGKGTTNEVFKACERGEPAAKEVESRKFFAHYYTGLYLEAKGDHKEAFEHLKAAATDLAQDHAMGEIAKGHFQSILKKKNP